MQLRGHEAHGRRPVGVELVFVGHGQVRGLDIAESYVVAHWSIPGRCGSHHHYKHDTKLGVVTIPGHPNDDLSVGTVRSIYKQAGLPWPGRTTGGST